MPKLIPALPIEVHDDGVHCGDGCPYSIVATTKIRRSSAEVSYVFTGFRCSYFDTQVKNTVTPGNIKRCQACLAHEKAEEEKRHA